MEFEDDAFVLSARVHGKAGAIVELLTAHHGKWAAHVAGGASRRMKPFLQAGAQVTVRYRARVSDQLGSATLEPVGEGPSALFDDPVTAGALPEREPHPGAHMAFEALVSAFAHDAIWPAVFVRFEAGLLADLGFGFDLSKCAATGSTDDLIYVSPKTGRAVSREAGEPYKDRLLALPPFLLAAQSRLAPGDVGAGLALTAYFLEAFIFNPMNRPLPPARLWLLDRLTEAGRL
jgi:DNA repair protein RecO (recombination protein O)